jgi:hypothetical protein
MLDAEDPDLARVPFDLVHDPIRPSARGPEPLELPSERVTDPAGILRQGPGQELDDRGGDLLGESGQRSIHGGSGDELPTPSAHRSR